LKLSNQLARHIAISNSGLRQQANVKCGNDELLNQILFLGYVQQDPIQVVARAHDHIVWSRNSGYQSGQIDELLKNERTIFEHFTHDACVLPVAMLPYWKIQFKRKAQLKQFKGVGSLSSKAEQKAMLLRIKNEGPLCSGDFKLEASETKKNRATWSKPRHKRTLDYFWLTGVLAVSKREKFRKYYDLAERIFPNKYTDAGKSDTQCIDWLANHALDRLGFATYSEIKGFWGAFTLDETKRWREKNAAKFMDVSIESFDGEYKSALTRKVKDIHSSSADLLAKYPLSKQMKILNPFDPLIRDRKRLLRLFGFDYRIEMYVPPAKRHYGYYVYPLLEYDKFVGRLEVKHDRERNVLSVENLWAESGIKFGKQRMGKLNSELGRLSKFCGAERVEWCS